MASNKLKVQGFRTNDLSQDTGKQFEMGRSWCDFLEIDDNIGDINFTLIFKPLSPSFEKLKDRQIELQLSGLTARNDRKAYANGTRSGHSAIKEFFLEDLHLSLQKNSSDYFAIYKANEFSYYLYYIPQLLHDNFIKFFESITPTVTINRASSKQESVVNSRQTIFYGAPGTGKSNTIKREVDDQHKTNFRVTFHPDSDYSTFVGCYKPTMKPKAVRDMSGNIALDKNKTEIFERNISYEFVPQAFTKAYTAAWNTTEEVYLIIEEINRGNCAQIFGDLFQLLDRGCDGFSEYRVDADSDLAEHIRKELINSQRTDIPQEVKEGKKLVLPSNLYIWATMNTSDQSLFPIDSAFKRRWDWMYVPIANAGKGWKIDVDGKLYDWWDFLSKVNDKIGAATSSEDKKLGYFFCKASNGTIGAETFVSKVVFYLWNDVFKDFADDSGSVFNVSDGEVLSFNKFYYVDNGITKVKKEMVCRMLDNLKVSSDVNNIVDTEEMENNSTPSNEKNYLKEILFPDGTSIDASTGAFEAYIEAVRKIGVERVGAAAENLKYRRRTRPLISKEKFSEIDGKEGYSYVQEGEYYFVKGAKTYTYVRILEDLNEMLQAGMTIRNK